MRVSELVRMRTSEDKGPGCQRERGRGLQRMVSKRMRMSECMRMSERKRMGTSEDKGVRLREDEDFRG